MAQRHPVAVSTTEATHCVNIAGRRARENVTRRFGTSVIRNAGRKGQRLHKKNNRRPALTEEVDPDNRTATRGAKAGVGTMAKERTCRQRWTVAPGKEHWTQQTAVLGPAPPDGGREGRRPATTEGTDPRGIGAMRAMKGVGGEDKTHSDR